jgi:hypothetical protein
MPGAPTSVAESVASSVPSSTTIGATNVSTSNVTGSRSDSSSNAIARAVGPGAAVVEFGPGDGMKAVQLLRVLVSPAAYLPVDIAPEAFDALYLEAYDLGLKGCTTFRPNAVTGAVLTPVAAGERAASASLVSPPGVRVLRSREGPAPEDACPRCGSPRTKPEGSCRMCLDCGLSKCA